MKFGTLARAALIAPLALGVIACSPPCETASTEAVDFLGGEVVGTKTTYESSNWEGPYLHFPGGKRYRIHHGLGTTPVAVLTYLAFDEHPLPGGNVSESAGNQSVIERVDDEVIVVRNDTCAEFWLRVVALTRGAGGSDAGTD